MVKLSRLIKVLWLHLKSVVEYGVSRGVFISWAIKSYRVIIGK